MVRHKEKNTFFWCLIVVAAACAPLCEARILFADRFDDHPDWDGRTSQVSSLTGETVGDWGSVWHSPQSTENYACVAAQYRYGTIGKGCCFKLSPGGGGAPAVAQESCLFGADGNMAEPSLFWGYRWRCSTLDWGSGGKTLKMTRLYSGAKSVIPGWQAGPAALKVYYDGSYKPANKPCYQLKDTSWHDYVWEFQRGPTVGYGVIRLWVDGSLQYEDTAVNWNDTGTTFHYDFFPMLQGNLSGDYSGGDLYTYWDDYVWATTLEEVRAYMGLPKGTTVNTTPTIQITDPTLNPSIEVNSSSLTLGGTSSPDTGIVSVTWTNSAGGGGVASGTTAWSVSNLTLREGLNVITVAARDISGTTVASDVISVTLVPAGQEEPAKPTGVRLDPR